MFIWFTLNSDVMCELYLAAAIKSTINTIKYATP